MRTFPLTPTLYVQMSETSTCGAAGKSLVGNGADTNRPNVTSEDMTRLLQTLAGSVFAKLPRSSDLAISDLVAAGRSGLAHAMQTFCPQSGAPLAGYAKFHIRGEMLNAARLSRISQMASLG